MTLRHGEQIEYYVSDPRKFDMERYFRERGLPVWARDKNAMSDRKSGHARIVDYLSIDPDLGRPKLFVLSDSVQRMPLTIDGSDPQFGCPMTIGEWRGLRRKPGVVSDEFSEAAMLGRDEAYDVTRYFLASRPEAPRLPRTLGVALEDFEPMDPHDHWRSQPAGGLGAL